MNKVKELNKIGLNLDYIFQDFHCFKCIRSDLSYQEIFKFVTRVSDQSSDKITFQRNRFLKLFNIHSFAGHEWIYERWYICIPTVYLETENQEIKDLAIQEAKAYIKKGLHLK